VTTKTNDFRLGKQLNVYRSVLMNKNNLLNASAIAALALFSNSTVSAASFEVHTFIAGVDTFQGPFTSGVTSLVSTDADGSTFDFTSPAIASATANEAGQSAVSAEGIYACGSCLFELTADSYFETSYTNNTAGSIDFTYNFLISGPSVEILDYAYVDQSSGLGAEATANIFMSTTGGVTASQDYFLTVAGGRASHIVSYTPPESVISGFTTEGGFGYQMDDIAGSFAGVLAAGETVTISSELIAAIYGPGWEVGAKASIGDPNSLSATPGFSGAFNVSAVPVPAAIWLFGSGLIGLIGVSRRKV